MAFKRYIYKHGKRLGPYYYENVRGKDGGVKTVYLGTNPQHHPKHRIRKPLFFLIFVLVLILILGGSLFLLQNKSYLIKKVQQPDFDIDQILLKVLVRSGEFIEKEIRVMNTGSEPITISIETLSLEDIVNIGSSSFAIKPGQTKIVALNFSSIVPEQKIEQQPGIYIGKLIVASQKASKEIPILVEIETKNVLFDMNLNPVAIERNVKQGSDTTIEVRLFNLESIESVNVDVEYFVKDINGNTIVTESETVVAKTQASFFKTISIPKNLKPGPYVFAAKAKFGSSVGTASYLFYVIGPEVETSFVQFCKNSLLCLGLSLTTILLLFALMAYFYFFIGAYLYEKVTGVVTLPKRKEKSEVEELEAEAEKPGIFESIKSKISGWKAKRELKRAEKEKLRREDELQSLAEEREAQLEEKQLEEKRKHLEEEVKAKELERKEEFLRKQEELQAKQKEMLREEEARKLKKLEAKRIEEEKRREEEAKREKIERERLWSERKKQAKEFLHKFGMFKTPEEKRQIELQKEKEKQERLRREEELKRQKEQQRIEDEKRKQEELKRQEELRKQKEIEAKQREEERRKKEEELQRQREFEQKSKEEEERRREEALRKQKEAEAKKKEEEQRRALEQKKKLEEEERRKLEQEERQRELERQRQEKIKAKKLEEINEVEAGLRKNKEIAELIKSKVLRLESEKGPLSNNINELDARIKHIDNEIIEKLKQSRALTQQKKSLNLSNNELQKHSRDLKIKELKAALAEKQNALTKELEEEISQLSPEKRKSVEKWKRLELKAKLKIEEHALEEELKKHESKAIDERRRIEESYRGHLKEISKKQRELRQEIANFEIHKEQILREKNKLLEDLQDKETRVQKTKLKLENNAKEQEYLISELSRLKSELSKFSLGFFGSLLPGYKEKVEVIRKEEEKPKEVGEKLSIFDKLLKKEGPAIEEAPAKEVKILPAETKESIFKSLFDKLRKKKPLKEKVEEQIPAKSDLEELEESIRSLGLFKELEKGAGKGKFEIPKKKPSIFARLFGKAKEEVEKPEEKKPEKIITGKSKDFEKCHKSLIEAKGAFGGGNLQKAKKIYAEARNHYISLNYHEKKDIYNELMELYNKLK